MKTYLGLGSNLGDREVNLSRAISLLDSDEIRVVRTSAIYETAPRYIEDQPRFLNLVLEVETELAPLALLWRTRVVEDRLGRQRHQAKGPRTADVDILMIGNTVLNTVKLVVPHPGIAERRFVLEPLAEIAPNLIHPVLGKTARELLATVKDQDVRPYSRRATEGSGS
ncbi:MAG: 2-amino-4-hydroxy-6-hydroxymethyldihydropteridine diphosphokinase [bacterium]|nr:2-amino-4-hydroxy-6-hydroxymethyldihydropteridine diphosphokinase [bacterium]